MNKKHSTISTDKSIEKTDKDMKDVTISPDEETKSPDEETKNESLEEKPEENIMEHLHLILETQKKQYEDKMANLTKESQRNNLTALEQLSKQHAREIDEVKKFALQQFAKDMLLVGDALRAGTTATPDNYEKFLDGIQMTNNIFLNILEKHKVRPIIVKIGDEFDEKFHECLGTDGEGSTISQVLVTGYVYNDRVLRATQVIVGTKK